MDRPGLKLLYVSNAYTTHDRRFLELFCDAGMVVSHLNMSAAMLDSRKIPERVTSIEWRKDTADLAGCCEDLRLIIAGIRPDVVLAGPVPTSAYMVALAGFSPLISMSWGSDLLLDAQRSQQARFAAQYALRRSNALFGDCQAVIKAAKALAPLSDEQVLAFPWGIDLGSFSPGKSRLDIREKLEWTDKRVIISTRSWEPVYAIDVLVKAFASVRSHRPDARLILIGDGSLAPQINALIDHLDVRRFIHTPGRVRYDLLPDYFRLADCYVSSSLSDGTSISLLEAMACGLPVVVTEGYGNAEWVTPGRNGWLVKAGDSESMAKALLEALCDSGKLAEIRQSNIAQARLRADWEKNSPQLVSLIRDVASASC
jgi:glycosyltransferase involved in cell wall biosynthesis